MATFQTYDTVTSTMDVARENLRSGQITFGADGTPNVAGVLARTQTAGRGQRGRVWHDTPGESLCVTYYFRAPGITPDNAGELAFVAGAGAALALDVAISPRLPRQLKPPIGLKWPNDLLLGGKKVGGILIEMATAPAGEWVALIGLGLNIAVRDFPPELASVATSLALEGAEGFTAAQLAERILEDIWQADVMRQIKGFGAALNIWRSYDTTPGRRYETQIGGEVVQGVAMGIDEKGALLLRLPDSQTVAVQSASSLREIPETS